MATKNAQKPVPEPDHMRPVRLFDLVEAGKMTEKEATARERILRAIGEMPFGALVHGPNFDAITLDYAHIAGYLEKLKEVLQDADTASQKQTEEYRNLMHDVLGAARLLERMKRLTKPRAL